MNKKEREMKAVQEWNNMKILGKNKYVLFNGIAKIGFGVGILIPVSIQLLDGRLYPYNSNLKLFLFRLVATFFVTSVLSCMFLLFMWRSYEKKYSK